MTEVIPASHQAGDQGMIPDLNNTYAMLAMLTKCFAQQAGVVGGTNSANIAAVKALNAAVASGQSPIYLAPSGDTTGAKDNANIAAVQAFMSVGAPIVLFPGGWYIKKPIVLNYNGASLWGLHGATPSGDDAGSFQGSVIHVVAGFTNPTYSAYATAAVLALDGNPGTGTTKTKGVRIRDLWVDLTSAPASVDGIAMFGPVQSAHCQRVGVFQATGKSFAVYSDSGNATDGTHYMDCLAQQGTSHGWFGQFTDASLINCHAQSCGGDGFYITGGNNQLDLCRSDLNANGYTIDHAGGTDGYDDFNLLSGCTTQRNAQHGLNVINSSGGGTGYRMPVKCDGCCFTGDGTSGTSFAGASVQGVNQVEFVNCSVRVYTKDVPGGCPSIGLRTATPGIPTSVQWTGGSIQCASGGSLLSDGAGAQGAVYISPGTVGYTGYASSSPIQRYGSALAAGTTGAVVSNAWVTSSCRIKLSWGMSTGDTAPLGALFVSARSAGSFTVKSTNAGDTNTHFNWEISSQ